MLWLITYKVRSENGHGFLRPGLKMDVGNEIGSGFGDVGGTPPPKISKEGGIKIAVHTSIMEEITECFTK